MTPKHGFKKGDRLLWCPGFRHAKVYGPGPHDVIYVSGNENLRARSTIHLISRNWNILVLNTRLVRIHETFFGL